MSPEADGGPREDLEVERPSDGGSQGQWLRWLNALPAERAAAGLAACCGSRRWAAGVAAARPFAAAAEQLEITRLRLDKLPRR
jgi:hypothetical protein